MDAVPFEEEVGESQDLEEVIKNRKVIASANLDDSDPLSKIMQEHNKIMQNN